MGDGSSYEGMKTKPGSVAKARELKFKRRLPALKKACPGIKITKKIKSILISRNYSRRKRKLISSCRSMRKSRRSRRSRRRRSRK